MQNLPRFRPKESVTETRDPGAATQLMRRMAEAGIRARDPSLDEAGVRRELIRLLYGPEAASRLCGAAP